MHARKWLWGLVIAGTAAVTTAAGCGNSSSSSPPADSGSDQSNQAPDTGAEAEAMDTGMEAAPCVPDADITMLMVPDGGIGDSGATLPGCFACIQSTCGTELSACSADCTCNSAVQQFTGCLVNPAQTVMQCATQLISATSSGSTGLPLVLCVAGSAAPGGSGPGCLAACGQGALLNKDGGTDGATDGATEASTEASTGDASGDGSTDAPGQ